MKKCSVDFLSLGTGWGGKWKKCLPPCLKNFSRSFLPTSLRPTGLALVLATLGTATPPAFGQYEKAVEGNEVVKGKLYPRQGRWHVGAVGGAILNPSFVDTMLFGGSVGYHLSDWHGFHLEGLLGRSQDRSERTCVESFFFNDKLAQKSGAPGVCDPGKEYKPNPAQLPPLDEDTPEADVFRKKPAYMPIRQIDMIVTANYQFTPVYGKALWFLSSVGYLDFFLNAGVGFAKSTVWPLKTTNSEGELVTDKGVTDNAETGVEGRPAPESTLSPVVQLGIGNRFYFARNFTVEMHFRNISIFALGGKGQTELLNLALWGGVAMML